MVEAIAPNTVLWITARKKARLMVTIIVESALVEPFVYKLRPWSDYNTQGGEDYMHRWVQFSRRCKYISIAELVRWLFFFFFLDVFSSLLRFDRFIQIPFGVSLFGRTMRETHVKDTTPFWKRRRYFVVMMAFFGLFNVYALRVNLSVAIVAMTENRTIEHTDGSVTYEQHFPWDSKQKGYILSSFFYGYLMTQIVGGVVAARIGGNLVRKNLSVYFKKMKYFDDFQLFGIGVGVTALLTLVTPLAAKSSIYALIGVRVIEGLFEVIMR